MGQADLSSMGPLAKPMILAAMRLASKGKDAGKKKAEVKMKQKVSVKVKRG